MPRDDIDIICYACAGLGISCDEPYPENLTDIWERTEEYTRCEMCCGTGIDPVPLSEVT